MTLPVPSFAALAAGNQNLSLFDQQFGALAASSVIACTASGSNAVVLTPMTNYFVPSAYTDVAPVFAWKQAQTSTGPVTINLANLGPVNAYKNNGQTAVGSSDLIAGAAYTGAYLGALNSGAGGIIVDVVPTALATSGPVQAAFKNLVVAVISNTQVTVTADQICLFDGTNYSTGTSVSVTAATGTSGANGLDTGTITQATWYSVWVIQNTASGALAALLSASATAPTMPTGYAKNARVGWVTTAAAATSLRQTLQNGRNAQYVNTGSSPNTALPVITSGSAGTSNGTTFTPVSTSTAAFFPSTAAKIKFVISNGNSASVAVQLAPSSHYAGFGSASNPCPFACDSFDPVVGEMILETANTVFYASGGAGGLAQAVGWEDNI